MYDETKIDKYGTGPQLVAQIAVQFLEMWSLLCSALTSPCPRERSYASWHGSRSKVEAYHPAQGVFSHIEYEAAIELLDLMCPSRFAFESHIALLLPTVNE